MLYKKHLQMMQQQKRDCKAERLAVEESLPLEQSHNRMLL
jgi:hypothetical protein